MESKKIFEKHVCGTVDLVQGQNALQTTEKVINKTIKTFLGFSSTKILKLKCPVSFKT